MPVISGHLGDHGAVLDILVGVDEVRRELLRKHQFPVPAPVRVPVQIDTGTAYSAVDGAVLQALDLKQIDTIAVRTPSTAEAPHQFRRFVVSLSVGAGDGQLVLASLLVLSCHFLPEEGIQGLLGQDVLALCDFHYHGRGKTFSLEF
jgi:hypothetical protein